jgi:tyrosine-protein kinase Etk/Wzc
VEVLSQPESSTDLIFASRAEEISLMTALLLIVKNRRFIAKITLGVALVAAIISLLLPFRYTASTTILPPQQGGSA